MIKLIIFDLDGTLVDAYRAVQKSLNLSLSKFGYHPVRAQVVRRSVGWGDKNLIKEFVPKREAGAVLKFYRRHHKKSLLKYSRMIPGAKRVLGILKKQGYKLAIVSNRPEKFTWILLRHLGINSYFDAVACGKNKEDLKPRPTLLLRVIKGLKASKKEALYVGDMAIDVEAGRNAGVRVVSVTGGSSYGSELRRLRPFKVIGKISGLVKII